MTSESDRPYGISLLGQTHVAEIILYVRRNPGCLKTSVYRDIARGNLMPRRIGMLEELGILTIEEPRHNLAILTLTPKGERVADLLEQVAEEMSESE